MTTLRITEGLLQPYLYFTIPGTADLVDATIVCTMTDAYDAEVISASAAGCLISDAATRQAEYRWQAGDTDVTGTYTLFFTITPLVGAVIITDSYGLEILADISDEPVTIADVEGQIRFDLSSQSELIAGLIRTAREQGESITRRAFKPRQESMVLDGFPGSRVIITLPKPPLRSVDSIVYLNSENVETVLDPALYRVVINSQFPEQPSYIMPVYGSAWPVALNDLAVVTINYTCGYGTVLNAETLLFETISLPKPLRQWMLINIANLYENTETIQVGNTNRLIEIPTLANNLIADYRIAGW